MNLPRTDDAGGARWSLAAAAALLALATVATFQWARHGGFLPYDDDVYVTAHPFVAHGWTWEGVRAVFTRSFAANWHPLTWLSHMLDVELFGLERPAGHHLTSVFLHGLNAALLLVFLARSTGQLAPSFFAAALFALHPLRAESVAWIAERKDVLSGTFFLLTLLAYLRYARGPTAGRFAVALGCFLLGLSSKPTVVTLPFVLLLLDRWPLERIGRTERHAAVPRRSAPPRSVALVLAEKAALLVPALAVAWATLHAQASDRSVSSLAALPLPARIANALRSCAAYLGDTFVPRDLAAFYPHPALVDPGANAFDGKAALGLALLCALLAASAFAWRRAPWIAVGVLWYLGTLVPVIGLVQTGEQARADRYTYLPSIGIALALCFALARLAGTRKARLVLGVVGIGALAGLACATSRQVRTWRDGITLFGRAAEAVPRNYLAWSHLGVALAEAGRRDEARRAFEAALAIQPRHAEAENNLGQLLLEQGAPREALSHFERALGLEPGLSQAAGNLGAALAALGRDEEALRAFRRAAELAPGEAASWWNLGLQFLRLERREEALEALRRAGDLAPLDAEITRKLRELERSP
jgi:tetratricopeptide (TPR) repeat protein